MNNTIFTSTVFAPGGINMVNAYPSWAKLIACKVLPMRFTWMPWVMELASPTGFLMCRCTWRYLKDLLLLCLQIGYPSPGYLPIEWPSSSDHAEYEQDRLLDGTIAFIYHHWLNRSKRCFILTRTQVRYDELWLCLKLGYAGVAASIYHDVSVQFHHSFPIQIQFLSRESSILKVSAILKSMEIHQSTTHEGRPQRQLETIDGHAGLAGYSGYHVRWTDTNSWQGISWTVSDKFWHIWLNVLVHNSNYPTWKWLK